MAAGRSELQRGVSRRFGDRVFGDEVISIVPMVPIILEQTQVPRSLEDEFITKGLRLTLIHVR
jgi:hypothetical protein